MENKGFEDDSTCQCDKIVGEEDAKGNAVQACNKDPSGDHHAAHKTEPKEWCLIKMHVDEDEENSGSKNEVTGETNNNNNMPRKRWSLPNIKQQEHAYYPAFIFPRATGTSTREGDEKVDDNDGGDSSGNKYSITAEHALKVDLALPTSGFSFRPHGHSEFVKEDAVRALESWQGSSVRASKNKHQRWLPWFSRMSYKWSSYFLTNSLIIFGAWALLYILFGAHQAFPGGSLFSLGVLEISCILGGKLIEEIGLPPAIGMVSAGLILRNVRPIEVATAISPGLSRTLRAMSVVILLSRGALSVNGPAILKHWKVVPGVGFLACVFEALVAGTAVYFIVNFPTEWSCLMGCILSAMSGAIVMPYLISLDARSCESTKKAIFIAKIGSGLDAILAICMAEFALGFIFANGDLVGGLTKGALEVLMGGAFAVFWGLIVGFLFDENVGGRIQTFALFSGGCMGLLGLTKIGYPRGGPLGTFAGVLVASSVWRRRKISDEKYNKCNTEVQDNFTFLWFFFQPLLFGIIGSNIDLTTVRWNIVLRGMICLAISLTSRVLFVCFVLTSCGKLTWRQRMFLATAWVPKGTVQAALGPVALETAFVYEFGEATESLGYQVMSIAVATILVASFVGALGLLTVGRRLVTKG